MTKHLMLLVGLLLGIVLMEIMRRQKVQRITTLDTKAAGEKERFAEYDRQWQEHIANMPFDERMEYELWEAKMRLDNWMPDTWEGDNDAEA